MSGQSTRIAVLLAAQLVGQLVGLGTLVYSVPLSAQTEPAGAQQIEMVDFGRPCADPQPAFDASNPVDRLTRKAPRSNPATPLTQAPYPQLARALGQEGSAIVDLLVNAAGEVSQVKLFRSTGSGLLDAAALEETRHWKLFPGASDGKPHCMWGRFAITFKLTEYTDAELANTPTSPQAERVATMLLGMDHFERFMAGGSVSATERVLMQSTRDAFVNQSAWLSARRRVAAILSIEFTAAEMDELAEFYSSPLAGKLRGLQQKFLATIGVEERITMQSLMCTTAQVSRVLKDRDIATVFDGERLTDSYAKLLPGFVSLATPWCSCLVRIQEDTARGFTPGNVSSCGPRPELE